MLLPPPLRAKAAATRRTRRTCAGCWRRRYAGRKAIVWAHDVHVMNAYYDLNFRGVHLKQHAGDMKPTGTFLAQWLGSQVYTVGNDHLPGPGRFRDGRSGHASPAGTGWKAWRHGCTPWVMPTRSLTSRGLDNSLIPCPSACPNMTAT